MTARRRPTHVILALTAVLILVAALAAACAAQASNSSPGAAANSSTAHPSGDPASPAKSATPVAKTGKGDYLDDWQRVLDVLAYMQANKPTDPVVVLLGGSCARESTVDDQSWRDAIVADAKNPAITGVEAWNLGSRNRDFAQDIAIVRDLPKGVKTIVYIGVNLGEFTYDQKPVTIDLPSPGPMPPLQQNHDYSQANGIQTVTQKQHSVRSWMLQRYPVYKAHFHLGSSALETLVKLCLARHYYPVLFELPRNRAIIGSAFNTPLSMCRTRCQHLAAKYNIPYVSFVSKADLPNRDFYDLWHLIEPGRYIWQPLLAKNTAKILDSSAFANASP